MDLGSSSPDLESSATIHPFSSLSKVRANKPRGILGNSASGKLLPSKGGRRQEQPKGIFSSGISLPKLKDFQSHKKLVKQYKEESPKTFELPPYRGYQVDPSSHAHDLEVNKKTMDLLDSRYRMNNPLRESPHLTWRLHNKLRWQGDRGGKLEVRDVDNPNFQPDSKTEKEYLKETVQLSEDEEAYDSEKKDFIGLNAIKEFNMHYKMVEKIERENQIKKIKNSVYTEMLSSASKKSLLPMRMNLVKSVGNLKIINNSNFRLGNNYVEVLLKGLDDMPVEKLNLRNNNLTGENVTKHLDNVLHVIDLDLSENKIGKSLLGLKQPIISKNSQLRRLGLEKTQMSNHMAKSLLGWAETSESLKSLNIADNKLGDDIGESLISLITKNSLIEEIYLSWNNLSSQTAEPLFKALTPSSLKVLDLGWNQIGTNMKVVKKNADSSLAAICDCLANNKSLVHLSLNNNGFSMDESTKICEALKKNKTIYGFHFSGNNGYVDYLGYLQLDVSPLDIQDSIRNTKLNGVAAQSFSYEIDPFENTILLKNCCWICEGWIELDIIYPDNLAESEPVFLLLKHENYQLIYMPPEDSGKRRVKIMVPRMKLFFCFFLSDQVQCHPDFATVNLTSEETLSFEFLDQNYMFTVSSMNCLSFDCIQKPLFDSNFQVQCAAIPRTPREKYIPPKGAKNKRKWNFATSIFKTYKKDTDRNLLKVQL